MAKPKKRGRIARLFYIGSKRPRSVLHLSTHITEGYRTLCGVMIPYGTWAWARSRAAQARAWKAPICRKCAARAPAIVVQRVRKGK